jgi:hypothetical protein
MKNHCTIIVLKGKEEMIENQPKCVKMKISLPSPTITTTILAYNTLL